MPTIMKPLFGKEHYVCERCNHLRHSMSFRSIEHGTTEKERSKVCKKCEKEQEKKEQAPLRIEVHQNRIKELEKKRRELMLQVSGINLEVATRKHAITVLERTLHGEDDT